MRRSGYSVKSGDGTKVRAFGSLFVDDFLRVIETAATLRLAVERSVRGFGRAVTLARGFAHFLLGNSVAQAHDHARNIAIMRSVRNYTVAGLAIASGRSVRAVMSANGIPTSTKCAKSWVAIDSGLGGRGVPKRSGTTTQFITK